MDSIPMEKFNGFNFHTQKAKIQMHLMNRGVWSIVQGTGKSPSDPRLLVEWDNKEEKDKTLIALALSDTQLHLIYLEKPCKEIWEKLSKLFEEKAMNANFSLKLQLFGLKMHDETRLSTHINELMSLFKKLVDTSTEVDRKDAKEIILNSLSSKYKNVVFTLSLLPSQSLEGMVASLLSE
jgi:hypothetical protein